MQLCALTPRVTTALAARAATPEPLDQLVTGSALAAPWDGQLREVSGYPAALDGVDPSVAHTIHDLPAYLADNLGAETLAAVKGQTPFLVAVGEGSEVAARLQSQGWNLGTPVTKSEGFHRVNRAVSPEGKETFLIWRVNGDDRQTHIQSLLKLAGLPEERIATVGASRSFQADYLRTFQALGQPDLVVYGMGKTTAAAMLKTHPIRNAGILFDLFRRRGAPSVSNQAQGRDTDGLRMEVMELKSGQKVWFLPPLYGDLSRDLLGALLDHGVSKLHFVGTAGALNPDYRVGDVVSPAQLVDPGGQVQPLSWLTPAPADHPDATYMRVDTPNRETRQWAEEASRRGVDLVEVELAYWLQELAQRPEVGFTAQTVISDVLVGDHASDMTQWSWTDSSKAHDEIVGAVERALGVTSEAFRVRAYDSVPLATPPTQKPPTLPEERGGCWNLI